MTVFGRRPTPLCLVAPFLSDQSVGLLSPSNLQRNPVETRETNKRANLFLDSRSLGISNLSQVLFYLTGNTLTDSVACKVD